MASQTVVVAKQSLRFGTELSASMLQEVPWPSDALPGGAFAKIHDIMSGGRRVVLAAIEANEPVLALKITGPGQRATLSALVKPGMKAVTIRVNDVEGVGGFVLPGDHVDIVLTRQIEKGNATTEVVLQNTRVLAVDQTADERAAKATVAKSVTLEVDTVEAQNCGSRRRSAASRCCCARPAKPRKCAHARLRSTIWGPMNRSIPKSRSPRRSL